VDLSRLRNSTSSDALRFVAGGDGFTERNRWPLRWQGRAGPSEDGRYVVEASSTVRGRFAGLSRRVEAIDAPPWQAALPRLKLGGFHLKNKMAR
jgi:hypothetical protein